LVLDKIQFTALSVDFSRCESDYEEPECSMPIPTDPKLLDIACDVTIRFRGHRSYGDENGAIRALRRRAPGEYRAVFELMGKFFGCPPDRAQPEIDPFDLPMESFDREGPK
jgi:hypothetical protein